jgi:hypothetical protein
VEWPDQCISIWTDSLDLDCISYTPQSRDSLYARVFQMRRYSWSIKREMGMCRFAFTVRPVTLGLVVLVQL